MGEISENGVGRVVFVRFCMFCGGRGCIFTNSDADASSKYYIVGWDAL
jgi:hypothetical protein